MKLTALSKYDRVASDNFSPIEIVALIGCKVVDDRINVGLIGFITVEGLGPATRNGVIMMFASISTVSLVALATT